MNIKFRFLIIVLFLMGVMRFLPITIAKETNMDWSGLEKERIELKLPLLTIKGSQGFLACGYINVETCNKTDEACAIVSGVKTHDDMLTAEVKSMSEKAEALGVTKGMSGKEALERFR